MIVQVMVFVILMTSVLVSKVQMERLHGQEMTVHCEHVPSKFIRVLLLYVCKCADIGI